MRRIESIRNFDGEREKHLRLQRPPRDAMLQRQPVQKLHGDERLALMLANFVDGADVGMIQCGGSASFAAETFQSLRIAGKVFGKKLECDKATKLRVFGLVHHAHPAAAELFDDAVVRDGLADHLSGFITLRDQY